MKFIFAALLSFSLSPFISAQEPRDDAARLEANKQVLLRFLALGGDLQARRAMLTDDYVQHNPRFLAMAGSGGDAWLEAIRKASAAGRGRVRLTDPDFNLRDEPVILMAEGDLVTAIYKAEIPDPDDPSKTYEIFNFETVRIRDGKLAEHWDGIKLEAGWKAALEQ